MKKVHVEGSESNGEFTAEVVHENGKGNWERANPTPTLFAVNKGPTIPFPPTTTTIPFPSRLSSLHLAILYDQPCGRSQVAVLAAFFGDGPPKERGSKTLRFQVPKPFISTSLSLKAEKMDHRVSYTSLRSLF